MKNRSLGRKQALRRALKKLAAKPSKKPSPNIERAAAYKKKFKEARRRVDDFAKTHPRFDDLAGQIQVLLQQGLSLDDAYIAASTISAPVAKTKNRPRAKTRSR